jgi:PAS domain S-box-containing protein
MKTSDKFLRSLFEVSHVEFQTYDLSNHKLIFSSGMLSKILGYSPEEYNRHSSDFYKELIHPADRQKVLDHIQKICYSSQGQIIEMTVRVRRIDGQYIWVYSRQMVMERNIHTGACVIIREVQDVTEYIKLQDALERKIEQLQVISYKNSHLVRSPVASILGLVNMIEEQGITGEHNMQVLSYLKKAIEKLDGLIHEINDLTKL